MGVTPTHRLRSTPDKWFWSLVTGGVVLDFFVGGNVDPKTPKEATMAAGYVIADVDVTNPTAYEEYRSLVGATIAKYGGKYVVRGGPYEKIEGDWTPNRLVIIEFESVARAKEWYSSEEYAGPLKMRHQSASSNLIIVEGV